MRDVGSPARRIAAADALFSHNLRSVPALAKIVHQDIGVKRPGKQVQRLLRFSDPEFGQAGLIERKTLQKMFAQHTSCPLTKPYSPHN